MVGTVVVTSVVAVVVVGESVDDEGTTTVTESPGAIVYRVAPKTSASLGFEHAVGTMVSAPAANIFARRVRRRAAT